MEDLISRQAAIDALAGMIDRFERILADIRETKCDDSVCGMCEYDGAYIGQSGDWCDECPGFDKDDCFKLSDECRKRWMGDIALPSVQPDHVADIGKKMDGDCISRQAAIDELDKGAWGVEWDKTLAKAMIESLPSARPDSLSDAYMKAVWTWLLDYQIKAAELKGRYTPYEVLSWVANDWRKEHE